MHSNFIAWHVYVYFHACFDGFPPPSSLLFLFFLFLFFFFRSISKRGFNVIYKQISRMKRYAKTNRSRRVCILRANSKINLLFFFFRSFSNVNTEMFWFQVFRSYSFFFFLNIVVNCQFLSKFNTFLWEAEVKVQLRLIYRVTRNLKLDERDQWENWKASFLKFILLNDISKFLYKCFQHFQRTSLKPSDEISSLIIWPKKLESSNLNLLKTCVYI